MRTCNKCKLEKEDDAFGHVKNNGKISYRGTCKACKKIEEKAKTVVRSLKTKREDVPKPSMCDVCHKKPDETDFIWRVDKWRTTCKKCIYSKISSQVQIPEEAAVCTICNLKKQADEFEKTPFGKLRTVCKTCRSNKRKQSAKEGKKNMVIDRESVPKPEKCQTCGKSSDEVKFKWRTDQIKEGWRTTCTTCYDSRKYHVACRNRQREKDEEAYLARNAATHLKWAKANPENIKNQEHLDKTDPHRRLRRMLDSAKARDIAIPTQESDLNMMKEMITCDCYYCGFSPSDRDGILNGIDRVDSSIGYDVMTNLVPCCPTCNAIKCSLNVSTFIAGARAIAKHRKIEICEESDTRSLPPVFGGRNDLRTQEKKTKNDELTPEQKQKYWFSDCTYCGRSPAFGIDRIDSNGTYTLENTCPCCMECNYMKKDLSVGDFEKHLSYIVRHTAQWVLPDILNIPLRTCTGSILQPVMYLVGDKKIIFPTSSKAYEVLGKLRGRVSKKCTPYEYRTQC